jgi:DNA-binding PadR family transcriptional regulator
MERDGLIEPEWRMSDKSRRAKYYRITAKGRRHLERETRDWDRRATAIARLLEA